MEDMVATVATGRVSEAAMILVATCNLISSKMLTRCLTKTISRSLTIQEWASTARNRIISITYSNAMVIIIRAVEVIEAVQCTSDMEISIGTTIQITQSTPRTVVIVGIAEVEPQEDVAKAVNITAIITIMIMEMEECIIRNITNILVTKIIEVENITEIIKMTEVGRCIDVHKEAITNKSTQSTTTNTATKIQTTSIKAQWAVTRCSHSRITAKIIIT